MDTRVVAVHVVAETLLGENYKEALQIDTRLKNDKLINDIILLWYKNQLSIKGGQEPRRVFARKLSELGAKLIAKRIDKQAELVKSKFENMAQELDAYYYH